MSQVIEHLQTSIKNNRQLAIWLIIVCLAILIMLVLGGATRLTHSGLSMMTWDPLMGWIPPLSQAEWQVSFEHYKKIPEFYELNPYMDLEGYKKIFLLEYLHRVWGRVIGVIFLLPFLYFLFSGKIEKKLRLKMVAIFALGGLQGLMGWYMVSSGFDAPHVSQYRLTAHLLFAFLLYGYIFWVALGLLFPKPETTCVNVGALRRFTTLLLGLIVITITSGGFVAGLKAGFAYNTFPLMDGSFIPDGYLMFEPWYLNLFNNIAAVQFDHRFLAEIVLLLVFSLWLFSRRYVLTERAQIGMNLLLAATVIQVLLGIFTLVLTIPVALAVTHQGGSMILFTAALFLLHTLRQPRENG
ncbi:MAG: COX15/CtaA family protein [Mariprofundaceae bacterium]